MNVTQSRTYTTLHELSFNINFHQTSLGNDIKRVIGKLYNFSRKSFITAYVRMTTQELDSFYHMTFQRAETRVWARFPCASWM